MYRTQNAELVNGANYGVRLRRDLVVVGMTNARANSEEYLERDGIGPISGIKSWRLGVNGKIRAQGELPKVALN